MKYVLFLLVVLVGWLAVSSTIRRKGGSKKQFIVAFVVLLASLFAIFFLQKP